MYEKYWKEEENLKELDQWDGLECRRDLLDHFPVITFYLVSLFFVVVLISV